MKNRSFYMGTIVSSWLLAAMVVIVGLYPTFWNLLKNTFTHHWIGKLVITIAAFLLFGFFIKDEYIKKINNEKIAWYSMILSLAVILIFYLIEYFI